MRYTDNPEDFYRWNLKRAKAGDVSSAKELLHGFLSYLDQKEPFPDAILEFLSDGIDSYLRDAIPLEKGLHLIAPAHRKKGVPTCDPIPLVAEIYLLMKKKKIGKEKAKEMVWSARGVAVRVLEQYDKEWNLIRDFSIEELERLMQPKTPQ